MYLARMYAFFFSLRMRRSSFRHSQRSHPPHLPPTTLPFLRRRWRKHSPSRCCPLHTPPPPPRRFSFETPMARAWLGSAMRRRRVRPSKPRARQRGGGGAGGGAALASGKVPRTPFVAMGSIGMAHSLERQNDGCSEFFVLTREISRGKVHFPPPRPHPAPSTPPRPTPPPDLPPYPTSPPYTHS